MSQSLSERGRESAGTIQSRHYGSLLAGWQAATTAAAAMKYIYAQGTYTLFNECVHSKIYSVSICILWNGNSFVSKGSQTNKKLSFFGFELVLYCCCVSVCKRHFGRMNVYECVYMDVQKAIEANSIYAGFQINSPFM